MDITNMINYIKKTMKTLKQLWRTLENATRHQFDPINLTKKTYRKMTFQLLNKSLNFIPTRKVYNKHKPNKELESFYRLLRLKLIMKAYFKVNENTKLATEQQIFQP